MVRAVLDLFSGRDRPLTFLAASLLLVLEGAAVIVIVALVLMGSQLPVSTNIAGVSPVSVAIALLWVGGLLVIRRAGVAALEGRGGRRRAGPHEGPQAVGPRHAADGGPLDGGGRHDLGTCAVVTLVAGVVIEQAGDHLAGKIGLQGAVFGATFLAAATALPELSSGLASVRIGDHSLAFSDIFGGNAFLPVLFLMADVLAGTPALPSAAHTDRWMAGLGIVLTAIYVVGLVVRPKRNIRGMGADSLGVVIAYALGIVGLLLVK